MRQLLFLYVLEAGVCCAHYDIDGNRLLYRLANGKNNFKGKAEEILDEVIMSLVEAEIYYIILENNASEHSARRMAMKNAYENADEMLAELNLTYNKARQAGITQEIAEIAAGANS